MTYAERRLAELDALSRERELTDAEQREVMLRAKQDRRNRTRKQRYWIDPDYRAQHVSRMRAVRSGATC